MGGKVHGLAADVSSKQGREAARNQTSTLTSQQKTDHLSRNKLNLHFCHNQFFIGSGALEGFSPRTFGSPVKEKSQTPFHQRQALVKFVQDLWDGKLDGLVNNVGTNVRKAIHEAPRVNHVFRVEFVVVGNISSTGLGWFGGNCWVNKNLDDGKDASRYG